ncbi:coiled-coil domain-containing protein 60-like [Genypterus blacodes]|uniref:coiled-coil domain-containing protein 60-like n=1 Tax=Genypterus blacodes TaxID=154954 RepID=UPI003F7587BC
MTHRDSAPELVLVCGQKSRARSVSLHCAGRSSLERRCFDQSEPRKVQQSRHGSREASRRVCEGPLDLILNRLGQHVKEGLPSHCARAGKREDSVSLRKHLDHARRLASAIKQGQSYFHLLQKEEEEEQRQHMRREEQLRKQHQPPCFSSDSGGDSEWCPLTLKTSWSGGTEGSRRKSQSARPFTPVYYSLTSPLQSEAPCEIIYRQLCCLNWLLEALNLDRPGRVGPLTACWDLKDPGRGTTTRQMLNRERAVESKWEQFVSGAKPRRSRTRFPLGAFARLHIRRTSSSSLSVASLSALTGTTVGSSRSSLVPGAEEETELLPSECIDTLLDAVRKEVCASVRDGLTGPQSSHTHPFPQRTNEQTGFTAAQRRRPKSCPAKPQSVSSKMIYSKASMLRELRAAFQERMEAKAQSYVDTLELKARERLNSLQAYRAPCHVTQSHQSPHHVTGTSVTQAVTQETAPRESHHNNKHGNNMWLSTLLSSLPAEVCQEQAVSRVLEKLSGFAGQQKIRVRPQSFLKVLGGLEPWELCLPELCVAIEFVREHAVHLPRDEYDAWLQSKVNLPPQLRHEP